MPKIKISISIEEDVLTQIDKLAAERKQNRSECIESLCSAAMASPTPDGMIEFMKFSGPATELYAMLGERWSNIRDRADFCDTRIDIVVRADAKDYAEWGKAMSKRRDQR
jgi:hypothetical protein